MTCLLDDFPEIAMHKKTGTSREVNPIDLIDNDKMNKTSGESSRRPFERLTVVISWVEIPGYWVGLCVAWLILPLIGVLVYEVFMRYVLGAPTVWAYDMTYMLYGTIFMLGAAYALGRDTHVRADFIYQQFSPRGKAIIDGLLHILLFIPSICVFTWLTTEEAIHSWQIGERIPSSAWMPIIYPYKTVMPLTGYLLLIQAVAELLKCYYCIMTNKPYVDGSS